MKAKDNTGSNNPPTTQDILGMINSLSDRHVLKSMPPQYAAGFANAAVFDFETEKRVNPANKKDVDIYYRVGSTKVCIEVKCPIEEQQEPLPTITLSTAGRLPDHRQSMANVSGLVFGRCVYGIIAESTPKEKRIRLDRCRGIERLQTLRKRVFC
jgi:hypothetical protein